MKRAFWFAGAALVALANPLIAQAADAAAEAGAVATAGSTVEEVVVYGAGETRQVQAITQQEVLSVAPGTSPIKVIAKLPSVNFQSSDPFGAYEWAVRISVRGFTQNQMGFTLDGVPLGDMTYNNFNGLHISRAISSENLGRAELTQGAGSLETASSSNLGGTLKFVSLDPSRTFGGVFSAAYGSDDTYRGFLRLESGEVPGGGRGYISVGYQHADKWKGHGEQKTFQVNTKFVQPVGPAQLTAFFNFSDRRESDYQDLSVQLINRLGYDTDNISNDWATAVAIARAYQTGTPFPAPYKTPDDVYFDAVGLRQDRLGGVKLDWDVNDQLALTATAYIHQNDGQGHWDSPYVPSYLAGAGLAPISMSSQQYHIRRAGILAGLTYEIGSHTINAGVWHEHNDYNNKRVYYALDAAGTNRDIYEFQSNPFFVQFNRDYDIDTTAFHLRDVWQVTDDLKVDFGFRALRADNKVVTRQGSPLINGEIDAKKSFLPQVGVNYRLSDSSEVFADYTRNMRAFTIAPFNTTQAGFNAVKDKLEPETSDTFEIGYRFRSGDFQGVLAAYYVKFHDRLLSTRVGPAILGNPSALSNVGSVTSKGFEATGTWNFRQDWSLFGSYAYNDAQYDDDQFDGAGNLVARVSGKTVVDSPKHIGTLELAYDNGSLFGAVTGNYQSKRYYTFLNDFPISGRTIVDFHVGYRFQGDGWTKGLEVQANVTNLFDKKYISTIGQLGFINSDPTGAYQSVLVGAPRAAFVTVRKAF